MQGHSSALHMQVPLGVLLWNLDTLNVLDLVSAIPRDSSAKAHSIAFPSK